MIEEILESLWSVIRFVKQNAIETIVTGFTVLIGFIIVTTIACATESAQMEEALQDSSLVTEEVVTQDTSFAPLSKEDTNTIVATVTVRIDTVIVLSDLMPLDSLAAAMGVTSEFIWQSFLDHSVGVGYTAFVGLLLCLALMAVSSKLLVWVLPKVDTAEDNKQENLYVVASLGTVALLLIGLIGSVVFLHNAIWGPSQIINKEYYAMQNVIELVIPNKE